MKKLLAIMVTVLLVAFTQTLTAGALELDSGDNLVLTETIPDDLYLLAGSSNIDADVLGDIYIAGGSITINGDVQEDLVIVGGTVKINGNVGGDVRVMGGQVTVYGNVGDDLVVAGGTVDVGRDSVIGGTVLAAAGILTVEGNVQENIQGVIGMLLLNGTVDGDVSVTVQETLSISDNARILGDLNYSSLLKNDVPAGVVQGETNFNKFEKKDVKKSTIALLIIKGLSYISALIIALIFVLASPTLMVKASKMTRKNALKAFAMGVLAAIIAVVGSIVLMMTIVGIPIALMVFAAILIFYFVSQIFVAAWLGGYIVNFKKKKMLKTRLFFAMALMLLAYSLVDFIPYIGWVINLVLFLVGVGTVIMLKTDYIQFLRSKKMM